MNKLVKPYVAWMVLDWVKPSVDLPFHLAENVSLRKAHDWEIEKLRPYLPANQIFRALDNPWPYEYYHETNQHGSFSINHFEDSAEWNYWLIEISNNNPGEAQRAAVNWETAFSLSDNSYTWGPWVTIHTADIRGVGSNHIYQNTPTNDNPFIEGPKDIDLTTLKEITSIHSNLKKTRSEFSAIDISISLYEGLRELPNTANLKTLGYFSVIESLLTYQPKADYHSSLGKQLQQKLQLIQNRFDLGFNTRFPEINVTTVVRKLYNYRSCLAHGKKINVKEVDELGGISEIGHFLEYLTKRLILFSIEEPRLVLDLKEC